MVRPTVEESGIRLEKFLVKPSCGDSITNLAAASDNYSRVLFAWSISLTLPRHYLSDRVILLGPAFLSDCDVTGDRVIYSDLVFHLLEIRQLCSLRLGRRAC